MNTIKLNSLPASTYWEIMFPSSFKASSCERISSWSHCKTLQITHLFMHCEWLNNKTLAGHLEREKKWLLNPQNNSKETIKKITIFLFLAAAFKNQGFCVLSEEESDQLKLARASKSKANQKKLDLYIDDYEKLLNMTLMDPAETIKKKLHEFLDKFKELKEEDINITMPAKATDWINSVLFMEAIKITHRKGNDKNAEFKLLYIKFKEFELLNKTIKMPDDLQNWLRACSISFK